MSNKDNCIFPFILIFIAVFFIIMVYCITAAGGREAETAATDGGSKSAADRDSKISVYRGDPHGDLWATDIPEHGVICFRFRLSISCVKK